MLYTSCCAFKDFNPSKLLFVQITQHFYLKSKNYEIVKNLDEYGNILINPHGNLISKQQEQFANTLVTKSTQQHEIL